MSSCGGRSTSKFYVAGFMSPYEVEGQQRTFTLGYYKLGEKCSYSVKPGYLASTLDIALLKTRYSTVEDWV